MKKFQSLFSVIILALLSVQTTLAHHEGIADVANAANTATQSSASNTTILWIVGGIIVVSIVFVIGVAMFSGKKKK